MFFRNEYTPSTRKILIKEGNIGLGSSGFEAVRENRPIIILVLSLKGVRNMRLNKVKVFVQSLPLQTGNRYA